MEPDSVEQEFLTVQQVAKILSVSTESVRRRFKRYPGVIDIGPPRPLYGRAFAVLRIPRGALQRFIEEHEARRMHARTNGRRASG
jgi:hypothetical protein